MMDFKEGAWLVMRDWSLEIGQIVAVTPKLVKFQTWRARQYSRDDARFLAVVPSKEIAERLRDTIAGIDGEFERRERAAKAEFDERVKAARDARDKATRAAVKKAFGKPA